MDSFSDELRTNFGIQLENSHAIERSQLMVSVVSVDPTTKNPLNFVYKNRSNHTQALGLGKFIQSLEIHIPGGILLFFPSYEAMQFMINTWDNQQVKF